VNAISQPTVGHTPVMVNEVLSAMAVQPGGLYVDCTVSSGGHADVVLEPPRPAASSSH